METVHLRDGESSLIKSFNYDYDTHELTIYFKKYYVESLTYINVLPLIFEAFKNQSEYSYGRFYLQLIKNKYKLKSQNMADKILKVKIDIKKIKKEWLWVGEKGVYLNFTILYNEEDDKYGNNGMVVQDVPTEIYKKHGKAVRGEVLGNCRDFSKSSNGHDEESKPGIEVGKVGIEGLDDDLPF